MPPDVFVFSLTSVRCPVALCAPYCERVRIHSHNGRYRGIAPRAERHPARRCRLSRVRSPVARRRVVPAYVRNRSCAHGARLVRRTRAQCDLVQYYYTAKYGLQRLTVPA